MKLLTSEQTRTFSEIDELREFNNLQEQNYSWIQIPTFSGEYIPLEDNPICIPVIRDTLGISEDVLLLTAPFVQNQSVSVVRKLSVCMPTPFPKSA